MCIIFLASPPSRRTQHPLFWVLLEIITELYALSILFTINSRNAAKDDLEGVSSGGRQGNGPAASAIPVGQTELDRRVEGYQGSTPFGVRMVMPTLGYQNSSLGYIDDTTEQQSSSDPNSLALETPFTQGTEMDWRVSGDETYRLSTLKDGDDEVDIEGHRDPKAGDM